MLGAGAVVAVVVVALWSTPEPRGVIVPTPVVDTTATPRDQFAALVNLISDAAERGDANAARDLTQRALLTFQEIPLDARDVDSRYHVGIMQAVAGDHSGALAQADTIATLSPNNLFGYYLRGMVARIQGDSVAEAVSRQRFTAVYAAEMATRRSEYIEHEGLLREFLTVERAK